MLTALWERSQTDFCSPATPPCVCWVEGGRSIWHKAAQSPDAAWMAKPFNVPGLLLEKVMRSVGVPLEAEERSDSSWTFIKNQAHMPYSAWPLSCEGCRNSEALIAMLPCKAEDVSHSMSAMSETTKPEHRNTEAWLR